MKEILKIIEIIIALLSIVVIVFLLFTQLDVFNDIYLTLSFIGYIMILLTFVLYRIKKRRYKSKIKKEIQDDDIYNETDEIIELGNLLPSYCPKCKMKLPAKLKLKWIMIFASIMLFIGIIHFILIIVLTKTSFFNNITMSIVGGSCGLTLIIAVNKITNFVEINSDNPKYINRWACPKCNKKC